MVEAAETIAHEWGQNATVDLDTDGLDPIWWTQGQAACAV
jgi:hypothetical protein